MAEAPAGALPTSEARATIPMPDAYYKRNPHLKRSDGQVSAADQELAWRAAALEAENQLLRQQMAEFMATQSNERAGAGAGAGGADAVKDESNAYGKLRAFSFAASEGGSSPGALAPMSQNRHAVLSGYRNISPGASPGASPRAVRASGGSVPSLPRPIEHGYVNVPGSDVTAPAFDGGSGTAVLNGEAHIISEPYDFPSASGLLTREASTTSTRSKAAEQAEEKWDSQNTDATSVDPPRDSWDESNSDYR